VKLSLWQLQAGDVDGMKRALFQVHETQAFWALPGGEPAAIKQNAGIAYKAVCTVHLGLLMPLHCIAHRQGGCMQLGNSRF